MSWFPSGLVETARGAWFWTKVTGVQLFGAMASEERTVLNNGDLPQSADGEATASKAAANLQCLMLQIKGTFMAEDGRGVDYAAMKASDVFREYKEECKVLRKVDIASLAGDEKMAFFLSEWVWLCWCWRWPCCDCTACLGRNPKEATFYTEHEGT